MSGRGYLRHRRDFALGLVVRGPALDPDEQLLVKHAKDALEHWDGGDVVPALELRDERMRCPRALGHLLLREFQFVSTLADVRSDPVRLAQLADGGVLITRCPVLVAATGTDRTGLSLRLREDADQNERVHLVPSRVVAGADSSLSRH